MDSVPLAYETRYLAHRLCPQLLDEDLEGQSTPSMLLDKYDLPLVRACHTIEARVLAREKAESLQVAPGSAGFSVNRVTSTINDQPVTWYRASYMGMSTGSRQSPNLL